MTDNNQWIGDFHKALEERKEPKVEPPESEPHQATPSSEPAKGLADWVKRMGGTLVPANWRDGIHAANLDLTSAGEPSAALDNGPASISRAQLTAVDWPWRIIRNVK